jgi:hypothetical protein
MINLGLIVNHAMYEASRFTIDTLKNRSSLEERILRGLRGVDRRGKLTINE